MIRIIRLSSYFVIGGQTPFFGIGRKGSILGIGRKAGIGGIGRRAKMTGHSFLRIGKHSNAGSSDE